MLLAGFIVRIVSKKSRSERFEKLGQKRSRLQDEGKEVMVDEEIDSMKRSQDLSLQQWVTCSQDTSKIRRPSLDKRAAGIPYLQWIIP